MRYRSIGIVLGAALLGTLSASPAMAAEDSPTDSHICADIAQRAAEEAGAVGVPGGTAQFACLGDQVVVTVNSGTPAEQRVEMAVRYSDEAPEASPAPQSRQPLDVPYTSAQAANPNCLYGGYDRTIVSELQHLVTGCLLYGNYNPQTGAVIWQRHIEYEWTMYTGWPSAQNKLRTIPLVGSPTMSGTFTSFRQNGWFPPSSLSTSVFKNVGNTTTQGWVVDQLDEDASFSVAMGDIEIKDSQKGYDQYFDGMIHTQRFKCESDDKRCFYPDSKEAP